MVIKIGTRASQLALAQAQWVRHNISIRYPDTTIVFVTIKTKGDRIVDRPLSKIGGKGLFVKEIEEALQRNDIDVAVHSLKDVPAELPEDLCIGVIPEREDAHDVMISKDDISLEKLPAGSSIGTSSLRRAAQLLHYRSDLNIVPLRGNLDTRLRKLTTSDLQAIVVAAAGLKRIGYEGLKAQILSTELMLPAIGQGALGLELRRNDDKTRHILAFLDHYPTRVAVEAERSFLSELKGGCELPVAAFGRVNDGTLHLDGLVASVDGASVYRDAAESSAESAVELGAGLAKTLLNRGARKILDDVYGKSR